MGGRLAGAARALVQPGVPGCIPASVSAVGLGYLLTGFPMQGVRVVPSLDSSLPIGNWNPVSK